MSRPVATAAKEQVSALLLVPSAVEVEDLVADAAARVALLATAA